MKFDISRLLEHTRVLAEETPHRHTGEIHQRLAAAYIAGQLRSAGLEVIERETPVLGWEIITGPKFNVLTPEKLEVECAPYVYSGSTTENGLEGKLIRVGSTLVSGPKPWRKYAIIDECGQWRALVIGRPDGPAMSRRGTPGGSMITADGPSWTWPACIIGQDISDAIEDWLGQSKEVIVRYNIQTHHKPGCISVNVQGILKGNKIPDEVVIVGVHHDTAGAIGYPPSLDSPGANDNASGVAIFLELARLYKQQGSERTIWFCSFDGEERNLMGSSEFLRTISEAGELGHIVAYFGIDQAAYGDNFWILTSSDESHLYPKSNMRELARQVIQSTNLNRLDTLRGPEPLHAASDHWPFFYSGIPSILIGWHPFQGYHRGDDTFEKCVHDEKFLLTAQTADSLLQAILQQPPADLRNRPLNAGFVVQPPAFTNK